MGYRDCGGRATRRFATGAFNQCFPEETAHKKTGCNMTRKEIEERILQVFQKEFEIENPGLDDNLRDKHEFDSIDAVELLLQIEKMLGSELTQEEKKQAMDIRTINQVCDYVEAMARVRGKNVSP